MKTVESHVNIVKLSDIRRRRGIASSPFGPVRAGLTTSQIIHDPALSELLSDLERKVDDLISKSYTVLDTLTIDITVLRAVLSLGIENEDGTDIVSS